MGERFDIASDVCAIEGANLIGFLHLTSYDSSIKVSK